MNSFLLQLLINLTSLLPIVDANVQIFLLCMHNTFQIFTIFGRLSFSNSMKPAETIDYHIKFLWHSISNLYNQIAQEFDLTQATGYALLNIDSKEGIAATKIAPLMGMKATSLSRMLKKMESDDLIYKKKCDNDGRSVKIHLTEKGETKKKIARKVVKDFNQYLLERLDENDLKKYFETMLSIKKITEEYKNLKLN